MDSSEWERCPGSQTKAGPQEVGPQRGICQICQSMFTAYNGIIMAHGRQKPEPAQEAEQE